MHYVWSSSGATISLWVDGKLVARERCGAHAETTHIVRPSKKGGMDKTTSRTGGPKPSRRAGSGANGRVAGAPRR